MTETENFGLKKPDENDLYGDFVPSIFADNMDTIDSALFELSQKSGISAGYLISIFSGTTATTAGALTNIE